MLFNNLLPTLLILTPISAHFLLNYPNSLGFDDEKEATGPCGGFDVTYSNSSEFRVGGDAVALTSTHPESNWAFRATLDKTGNGNNWTDLLPVVAQAGLGGFCEPGLMVPEAWAGQQGVVQVIQAGHDGNLYQCAAVNFTEGRSDTTPPSCKNATGLTASFTTDAKLPASTAATAAATGAPSSTAATTGAPSPSPSASESAGIFTTPSRPLIWSSLVVSGLAAGFVRMLCL